MEKNRGILKMFERLVYRYYTGVLMSTDTYIKMREF